MRFIQDSVLFFWNGMWKLFHSFWNGIRILFHIINRKKKVKAQRPHENETENETEKILNEGTLRRRKNGRRNSIVLGVQRSWRRSKWNLLRPYPFSPKY